jgi:hypothetical protein
VRSVLLYISTAESPITGSLQKMHWRARIGVFTSMTKSEMQILPMCPEEEIKSTHYLQVMNAIVSDYFVLLGKPKSEMIFYRRLDINGNKERLHKIGRDFQMTRERVRQIVKAVEVDIQQLFLGKSLEKPRCRCTPDVIEQIRNQVQKFEENSIVMGQYLIEDAHISLPEHQRHFVCYIDLLMEMLGYVIQQYEGAKVYSRKSSITGMTTLCDKIETYLLDKIVPVSLEDISVKFQKSPSVIKTALNLVPWVEQPQNEIFQIKGEHLRTKLDAAYRLLKARGEPLHFTEIHKTVGMHGSASRLSTDPRFKNIGKTGDWALSEWNINSDTIIELVCKTLRLASRPMTYEEIATVVRVARPTIKEATIRTVIKISKENFVWVDDKTIALREWDVKGMKEAPVRHRVKYPGDTFANALLDFVGKDPVDGVYLAKKVQKEKFPSENWKHIQLRLYSCKALEKEYVNGVTCFKLRDDYEEHLKPRVPVSDRILNVAISFLSDGKERTLSRLMIEISKNGLNVATAYSVLRKSNRFEIIDSKEFLKGKTIRLLPEGPRA